MTATNEPAIKDPDAQRPVASAWRPTLRRIVEAFVRKDYALAGSTIASVERLPAETAAQIEKYILSYGETLIDLPDDAWKTSVSQWMETHWDVLVDLFTNEAGPSDLVLSLRVFEDADAYRYVIDSVHVP